MRLKIIKSIVLVGSDWLYQLIDVGGNLYYILTASGYEIINKKTFVNKHYLDVLYNGVIIEATFEEIYGRNIVTSVKKVDFYSKDL
jgi:hypothetical protein